MNIKGGVGGGREFDAGSCAVADAFRALKVSSASKYTMNLSMTACCSEFGCLLALDLSLSYRCW
jgi:hypothetical protein